MKSPLWGLVVIFIILGWITPDGSLEAIWIFMHYFTMLCIFVNWIIHKVVESSQKQSMWHE